jgi:hypothetical protein
MAYYSGHQGFSQFRVTFLPMEPRLAPPRRPALLPGILVICFLSAYVTMSHSVIAMGQAGSRPLKVDWIGYQPTRCISLFSRGAYLK